MRRLLIFSVVVATLVSACVSDSAELTQPSGATAKATVDATSPVATVEPTPTSLVIPTIVATSDPATAAATPQATSTVPPTPQATEVPPTATSVPVTATPVPATPVPATPVPATPVPATPVPPTPVPATRVPPTPVPATATPVPPTPVPATPTPGTGWVNPDCYVGPGAADEPVWWCDGLICVPNALHYGCPRTPPAPRLVQIGCTISKRNVVVDERLVFTAFQKPDGYPVTYAFNHGDGTIDRTAESHAYYADPGRYEVILLWQHAGGKGSTLCGTVTVTSASPIFNAADYLGHAPAWAEAIAYNNGFSTRIVRIDDQYFPGTTDYRLDRVNFEVDANVVTKATLG